MNLLETYNTYKDIINEAWSNISTQSTEDEIEQNLNDNIFKKDIINFLKFLDELENYNIYEINVRSGELEIIQHCENIDSAGYTNWDSIYDPENYHSSSRDVNITCGLYEFSLLNRLCCCLKFEILDAAPFQEDYIGEDIEINVNFNPSSNELFLSFSDDYLQNPDENQLKEIFLKCVNTLKIQTKNFYIPENEDEIEELYDDFEIDIRK